MNLDAVVRHYRAHFQKKAHDELESFRDEATPESAVRRAALAEDSRRRRYPHQHRLKRVDLERAAAALKAKVGAIEAQPNFARLFELVEPALHLERGLGDLYIYDSAPRASAPARCEEAESARQRRAPSRATRDGNARG